MLHLPVLTGVAGKVVVESEIFGDGDGFGTVGGAVITAGAGNCGILPNDFSSPGQKRRLLQGEGEKVRILSSICSMEFMPLSTISTASRPDANRMAQEGMEEAGEWPFNMASAAGGRFTRLPPFTGSMTMTFLPCFTATS